MAPGHHVPENSLRADFILSGMEAPTVVKKIVPLILSIACLVGTEIVGQPLKGEESRRWQSAWAAAQQGRHQEALDGFKAVLEKKADQNLFLQAGGLLARQGAVSQAEELYRWGRARLKQPHVFADRLAELYQSQLKYDQAVSEWMMLLPAQRDLVRAKLMEIGQTLGWPKTAALAEANVKGGGDAGWLVLGGLYLAARDDRQAWGAFSRIKDPGLLRQAVDQVLASGLPASRQIPVLEEYLAESGQKDQDLLARLGWHYMEARRFQKASEVFSKMFSINRPLAVVYMSRARLLQGKPAEALQILAQGGQGKVWPDSIKWEARFLEADAWFMAGKPALALAAMRAAAGDSSDGSALRQKAAFKLAEFYMMSGDIDSALASYRRAVSLGIGGEASNDAMLRILLISEHKADRMEWLELFGRGLGEKAGLDINRADRSLSQVAEKNPGTTLADQAMLELALMRQELGEHRQAADAWRRLAEIASDPQLACRAAYQQGIILRYQLAKPDEAAEVWRQAVVKHPDFSWSDLMRQELAGIKQ